MPVKLNRAESIVFLPSGGLNSTNVQTALTELLQLSTNQGTATTAALALKANSDGSNVSASAAAWRSAIGADNASNLSGGTLPASRLPAFSGDASSSAGSSALTLATVNGDVGSFGSATAAPAITVDGKGRVTAVSTVTITPAWSSVTGKPTTFAPSAHTHSQSEITGLIIDLAAKAAVDFSNVDGATARTALNLERGPSSVPASKTSSGTVGEWAYDGSFYYRCVGTNAWRRTPLAEW